MVVVSFVAFLEEVAVGLGVVVAAHVVAGVEELAGFASAFVCK